MTTCEDCHSVIDSDSFYSGCFGHSLCQDCLDDMDKENRWESLKLELPNNRIGE